MLLRTRSWHHLLCWLALFSLYTAGNHSSVADAGTFEVSSRRDAAVAKLKTRASQFLQRATFGPTIEDIDALAVRMGQIGTRRACEEWIDQQMALTPSFHQDLAISMYREDGYKGNENNVFIQRYRYHAWWDIALRSEDQLRQRVAWALAQILVTSKDGAGFEDQNFGNLSNNISDEASLRPRWLGPSNYYDLLVKHSFGNYSELLTDVTYHPVMGVYLSHMRNRKADPSLNRFPDENYAREIMQLFTIGLYELHQDGRLKKDDSGNLIPTYDNEVIKEFSKVFTGLAYKPRPTVTNVTGQFNYGGNDFQYPMQMFNHEHEPGPKTLLGGRVVENQSALNSEPDGDADIRDAIENLMSHQNVAPFISRRLIQRLVKSNPSRAYIRRVARKFASSKGDLGEVVKAILLDPEAWRGQSMRIKSSPTRLEVKPRGTDYSSLAEPMIRYTRFMRANHPESDYRNGQIMMMPRQWQWIQEAYNSASVFNFYLPDYQPPGSLTGYTPSRRIPNGFLAGPEFQIKTAVTSNVLQNRYYWDTNAQGTTNSGSSNGVAYLQNKVTFNWDREKEMASTSDGLHELIDHLDLVYCCGTMPQDFKDQMHQVITDNTSWQLNNGYWRQFYELNRVQTAIRVVVCSPFCAVTQ